MTNLNLASLEKMEPEVRQETYEPSKGRYITKADEPTNPVAEWLKATGIKPEDSGSFFAPYVPLMFDPKGKISAAHNIGAKKTITVTKPDGPAPKLMSSVADGIHPDYVEYASYIKAFNTREGVNFGYLNSALGEINKGSLTVIGGPTGSGLSTLLMAIASEYEAANPGKPYAVCSNEVGLAFIECAKHRGITLKNAVLIDTTKPEEVDMLGIIDFEVLFIDDLMLADGRSELADTYTRTARAAKFARGIAVDNNIAVITTVRTQRDRQDELSHDQVGFRVAATADSMFVVRPSATNIIKLHNIKYRYGAVGSLDMMEWDRTDRQFNVYKKVQRPPKATAYDPMAITEDFIFPKAGVGNGSKVESLPKTLSEIQSVGRALRKVSADEVLFEELADIAREHNINTVTSKSIGLADIEVKTVIAKPRQLKASWTIDPIGKLEFDTDFELN